LSDAACDADRKTTSNQRIYYHPAHAIMYVQKITNAVMQTAATNATA